MKKKNILFAGASLIVAGLLVHQGFTDTELFNDAIESIGAMKVSALDENLSESKSSGSDINALIEQEVNAQKSIKLQEKEEDAIGKTSKANTIQNFTLEDARDYVALAKGAYVRIDDDATPYNDQMKANGYTVYDFKHAKQKGDRSDHAGYVYIKGNEVVVSFRGTQYGNDWAGDFNAPKMKNPYGEGELHSGFKNRFMDLVDSVNHVIVQHFKNNKDADLSKLTYRVAGHSLGAALATIYVDYLMAKVHVSPDNITLATVASPRVGNEAFAKNFESKMGKRTLRIHFFDQDIVTGVGPSSAGYRHVGQPLALEAPVTGPHCHMAGFYIQALDDLSAKDFKISERPDERGYVRYVVNGLANGAVGAAVSGMTIFANSPLNFGKRSGEVSAEELPQVKLFISHVSGDLEPAIRALYNVNKKIEKAEKNKNTKTLSLLKAQKIKELNTLCLTMEKLEQNPAVVQKMPTELYESYGDLKTSYEQFKKVFEKAQLMAEKIDHLESRIPGMKNESKRESALETLDLMKKALENQEKKLEKVSKEFNKKIEKSVHTYQPTA